MSCLAGGGGHLRLSPGAQSRRISWMPVMVVMASLIQSGVNTASQETAMSSLSCSSSSTRKVIMKRSCRTLVSTTMTWVSRNRRMRPVGARSCVAARMSSAAGVREAPECKFRPDCAKGGQRGPLREAWMDAKPGIYAKPELP